jgi:hypothetical protein
MQVVFEWKQFFNVSSFSNDFFFLMQEIFSMKVIF